MLKYGNPNADYLDLPEDNSTYSRKEFLCWQQLYTLKNQFILSWTFLTKTVEDPKLDSARATEWGRGRAYPIKWYLSCVLTRKSNYIQVVLPLDWDW